MSRHGVPVAAKEPDRVELTGAEKDAVEKRMAALDEVLKEPEGVVARYKIEFFTQYKRTSWTPMVGILSFWESGKQAHGGGDQKVYLCPGRELKINECSAVIPTTLTTDRGAVCPVCRRAWRSNRLIGEHTAKLQVTQWADILARYFRLLQHSCDIYMKHGVTDIREAALLEQARQMHGDKLRVARNVKTHVYPLRNILKDTGAGAVLETRLRAFLVS